MEINIHNINHLITNFRFVRANYWLYYVAIGLTVVLLITLACFESARRKSPLNLIILFVFTLCEGFMLGTISTFYSVDAILIAVGITAGVSFCLTIFAFQTKIDFTNCGGMLCALLVILFIAGILLIFLPKTKYNRYCEKNNTCYNNNCLDG